MRAIERGLPALPTWLRHPGYGAANSSWPAKPKRPASALSPFRGLGQLLGAALFSSEEVAEIRKVMLQRNFTEEVASTQVFGLSFSDLGIGIARHWGFPPV
ncbi:MAG: hypothetical protein IPM01_31595 [Burkholderiaceae bacterium]|nr:hypothetical protein [Burkholderiaceae bacterium]